MHGFFRVMGWFKFTYQRPVRFRYGPLTFLTLAILVVLAQGFLLFHPIRTLQLYGQEIPASKIKRAETKNQNVLGVSVTDITAEARRRLHLKSKSGVLITKVAANSIAEKAGLQPEDLIRKINNRKVESTKDYSKAVEGIEGHPIVNVLVERRGVELDVSLNLAAESHGT